MMPPFLIITHFGINFFLWKIKNLVFLELILIKPKQKKFILLSKFVLCLWLYLATCVGFGYSYPFVESHLSGLLQHRSAGNTAQGLLGNNKQLQFTLTTKFHTGTRKKPHGIRSSGGLSFQVKELASASISHAYFEILSFLLEQKTIKGTSDTC